MNKYLGSILLFVILLAFELTPFLYEESYALNEIGWTKIVVIPLGIFVWLSYKERKFKRK